MKASFCGYNNALFTLRLEERMREVIEGCILIGIDEFLFGNCGRFDYWALGLVNRLKDRYAHIKSIFVTPYNVKYYNRDAYDDLVCLEFKNMQKNVAVIKTNEWIIDESCIIIACVKNNYENTSETLNYAIKKGKLILNLADAYDY